MASKSRLESRLARRKPAGREHPPTATRRLQKVPGVRGLYVDASSGTYLRRVQTGGRDTYQSLGTRKKPQALATLDDLRLAEVAARHGLVMGGSDRQTTVQEVLERYRDDGFPDPRGFGRGEGRHLEAEKRDMEKLLAFFDDHVAQDLTQHQLDEYHDHRVASAASGQGHRATDLELNTLNNAMKWAVRKQLLASNPIANRVRYHQSSKARHCRDLCPVSPEELHDAIAHLFSHSSSEVLGWQALFEAFTGLRTSEALGMRWDAAPNEPGWTTSDGRSLVVRRTKKGSRENPCLEVHPDLRRLLDALRVWRQRRHPESPWFFPGRSDLDRPVYKGALTHALDRLLEKKLVARKFTSHGMRAYYVLVRRSNGISDTQIAWEINHVGGVSTLESVYGGVPAHWRDSKGPRLGWLPASDPPAWERIPDRSPAAGAVDVT